MNGFNLANISEVYYGSNKCRQIMYEGNQIFPYYTDPNYTTEFTITSTSSNNTISLNVNNTHSDSFLFSYKINVNDNGWNDQSFTAPVGQTDNINVILNNGDFVRFRGNRLTEFDVWCTFRSTGTFTISGNLLSLIYGYDYGSDFYKYWTNELDLEFYGLFFDNHNLTSAENLIINATGNISYDSAFAGCSNMTIGPKLVAPILASGCYVRIFQQCYNLNTVYMLADDVSAENCLAQWLNNTNGGIIYKKSTTTIPSGYIPSGWTTQNI